MKVTFYPVCDPRLPCDAKPAERLQQPAADLPFQRTVGWVQQLRNEGCIVSTAFGQAISRRSASCRVQIRTETPLKWERMRARITRQHDLRWRVWFCLQVTVDVQFKKQLSLIELHGDYERAAWMESLR